ncbi:MAG: hypothetical protein AAGF12_42420, partial [Myxococcota bacterium]
FDGRMFREIDQVTTGWTEAIWNDGDNFFVSAPGTGLWVFEIDADGNFIQRSADQTSLVEARRLWGDGTFLYVPTGPNGLLAYRYDGMSLVSVGAPLPSQGWAQGVWTDGTTVFFADKSAFFALRFDGMRFVTIDQDTSVQDASRVWGLGGLTYVGTADGISTYRLAGDQLRRVSDVTTGSTVREVWSDGVHVFAAAQTYGVVAYRRTGEALIELDREDTDGTSLGVVGDGTFIYVGDGMGGIRAYSGFACRTF